MKSIIKLIIVIVTLFLLTSCTPSYAIKDGITSVWKMSKKIDIDNSNEHAIQINNIFENKLLYFDYDNNDEGLYKVKLYDLKNDKVENIGDYGPIAFSISNYALAGNKLFLSDAIVLEPVPQIAFSFIDLESYSITKLKDFPAHQYTDVSPIDNDNVLYHYAKPLSNNDFKFIWEIYNIPTNTYKIILEMDSNNKDGIYIWSASVSENFMYCVAMDQYSENFNEWYVLKYDLSGKLICKIPFDIRAFLADKNGEIYDSINYTKVIDDYFFIETINGRGAIYRFNESGIIKTVFESKSVFDFEYETIEIVTSDSAEDYWNTTNKVLFFQSETNKIFILDIKTGELQSSLLQINKNKTTIFTKCGPAPNLEGTSYQFSESSPTYNGDGITACAADAQGNVVFQINLVSNDISQVPPTEYIYYRLADLIK